MVKRVCAIVTAVFVLFTALPMLAEAAQPFAQQQLIKNSIAGLKQKIATADDGQFGALNAITVQFLDVLATAGIKNDRATIQLAAMRYVADVKEIEADTDNTSTCNLPFLISVTSATVGLYTAVTTGDYDDSPFCYIINVTNRVADIMIASTKKEICLTDPSDTARLEELAKKLACLAQYNFATSAINVFFCIPAPATSDYITLLFDFLALFPAKS